MRKTRALMLGILLGGMVALAGASAMRAQGSAPEVMVYKTPTCGCCVKWVDHMRANGFTVKTQDLDDITSLKQQRGVPLEAGSCHTAVVGGYVVEGHVPADAVQRLLRERPKVKGIAVPGMPAGSPGMELPDGRRESYPIVTFDEQGRIALFERR